MDNNITSILLEDFKSFAGKHEIPLAPLTILAGLNNSGKSSVIQALRIYKNCYGGKFSGNYGIDDIGHFDDMLCDRSDADVFSISINLDKTQLEMTFSDNEKNDNSEERKELFDLFSKKTIHYVSAHRLGPQVFFHTNENLYELSETGNNIVYFYKRQEKVKCTIIHPNSETDLLLDNLNAWMGEISPGVKLNFHADQEQDTSRVIIGEGGQPSAKYRATNAGFGLSYSLPIVLLSLCSKPGDILIVENPEAHIHPKAQSKIVELMAMAAAKGVQIIIETHSDHIIDGARVAIKQQKIACEDVTINFFRKNVETGMTDVEQIHVNGKGELSDWPEDFFDQSIKNLGVLLGK